MTSTDKAANERTNQWNQNQSDTKRRTRMRESSACIAYRYVCAHACMPSHRHSQPARSCVCVESVMCGADVAETPRRASCGTARPVCHMAARTHDINRQSGEQTNQWNQNQSDTKRRTRMRESALHCICMCACVHAMQARDTHHSLQDRVFVSRA